MRVRASALGLALFAATGAWAVSRVEKVRNDKVLVVQASLAPGEGEGLPVDHSSVTIYLDAGSVELAQAGGPARTEAVKRGQVVFASAGAGTLRNAGSSVLRFVRAEYLGQGGRENWGTTGLAPHYNLLLENQYGRVYDIRIAAGMSEPLHSHRDRVVVCLSGARLAHELPDGRRETSTLETGEIAWRPAGTHVGHNVGRTDLWAIAIEPK